MTTGPATFYDDYLYCFGSSFNATRHATSEFAPRGRETAAPHLSALCPMKNPCQSPLCLLSCINAYRLPPNHPVVIMHTVHAAATTASASLNHIHIENTVNPTYRSTSDTIPHGFEISHWTCVVLSGTPPVEV